MADVKDLKDEFKELAEKFISKITIQNTKNDIANSNTVNISEITKAYNNVVSRINDLDDYYSEDFNKAQTSALDTLIQTINYLLYTKDIAKYLSKYKNDASFINSLIGEDSPLISLLKELEKLIALYVNLNAENCSYQEDKDKFAQLDILKNQYNAYKAKQDTALEDMSSFVDNLNNAILSYNDTIALYNTAVSTANEETEIDEIEIKDVLNYARYKAGYPNLSDSEDILKSVLTTYNNNTHNKAVPTSLYKIHKMYRNVQSSTESEIPEEKRNGTTYLQFGSNKYGPFALTDVVSRPAISAHPSNVTYDNFIAGLSESNYTYFTYDDINLTYTKAKFSGNALKISWADGSFKFYYNFPTNSDKTQIEHLFGTFIKVESNVWDADTTYYNYNEKLNTFTENTDSYDIYKNTELLRTYLSKITASATYETEQNSLYYDFIVYLKKTRNLSISIKNLEKNIREKNELRERIMVLLQQLKELLKEYTGDNTLLNIDESEYDLTDPDEDGLCDITIKENSKKIARSFSIKDFRNNRFVGYMGEVDRSGYVGQKANIYISIPLTNQSQTSYSNKFLMNAPLLHMSNVTYKKDPKNIIFGLFNIRDYSGKIKVENEDEDQSEEDGGYKLDSTYIRFGGIFSGRDINKSAYKQSFRLKCNSDSSWSSGKILKKGVFTLHNVNITAKFNDEIIGNLADYDENIKFADKLDVSIEIKDNNSGIEYVYKSKDGLTLNTEFKEDHEDLLIDDKGKIVSFFTGEMEIKSKDDAEKEEDPTAVDNASDYAASKDVVVKLTRINESLSSYRIDMFLNPDSSSNDTYYEDKGNDPKTYLPMFASNWCIEKAFRKRSINTSGDSALEALSALLDLLHMFNDKDDIDALCPFDSAKYANIINKLNNAKSRLMASLLESLSYINGIVKTATIANTIYQNYDPYFVDTYTSEIQTAFTNFSSKISAVGQDSNESYLSGSFITEMESYLETVKEILYNNFNDFIEVQSVLKTYDNKLASILPSGKNTVDLSSTIALFYDIITGTSQTLTAMATAGEYIPKYDIYYSFNRWNTIYDCIPNGSGQSKDYLIDNYNLQLLYLLTQTYWLLEDTTEDNHLNNTWHLHKQYIKYILLNLIKENHNNKYYKHLFITDVLDTIKNYKKADEYIECSLLNFNSYYLNPYIYQIFKQLEEYDGININDFTINDFGNGAIALSSKALIYKAVLETKRTEIYDKLNELYDFFTSLKKPNIREIYLFIGFCEVLSELQTLPNERKYDVYKIDFDNGMVNNLSEYVKYIIQYRTFILSDENPVMELMQCYSVYIDDASRTVIATEVANNNERQKNIATVGSMDTIRSYYYVGDGAEDANLGENQKIKQTTLTYSMVQLAQLLYNKYKILSDYTETRRYTTPTIDASSLNKTSTTESGTVVRYEDAPDMNSDGWVVTSSNVYVRTNNLGSSTNPKVLYSTANNTITQLANVQMPPTSNNNDYSSGSGS